MAAEFKKAMEEALKNAKLEDDPDAVNRAMESKERKKGKRKAKRRFVGKEAKSLR